MSKAMDRNIAILDRLEKVRAIGLLAGDRDRKRNRAFSGSFMVAEPYDKATDDANEGGFCIVGNDLLSLLDEAIRHFDP